VGGAGVGDGGVLAGIQGGIHFNMGNPAQRAVDVTMDAYDQYQQALLDKYYADTLRDLGMAALGGGVGGGGDTVGPVGLFNRVTQGGGRYQQPEPVIKKKRRTRPPWDPKNPRRPFPTTLTASLGGEPTEGLDEPLADVAAVEQDGFDAGQFVSEVQADVAGGVPDAGVRGGQTDVSVAGFRPPTPPAPEEDWDKKDTKKYLKELQGSGVVADPGPGGAKLTLANRRALDSLQQRPPKIEKPGPIYNQGPQMRHVGGAPQPPWPQSPKAAAPSALDSQMADIMGGAGAPLGGQLAAQINKQGQENEFQNLATAASRGQDIAQATYGLQQKQAGLKQSQDQFRQQKAQDVMANLANRRGQRRPRTSVRVQG